MPNICCSWPQNQLVETLPGSASQSDPQTIIHHIHNETLEQSSCCGLDGMAPSYTELLWRMGLFWCQNICCWWFQSQLVENLPGSASQSAKLHMSLSRHLQNGVPMSPSSETCHILVTCRHVVATWQDILTHIIGGSCRVMSSPWRHVVIYQFMVIWSTLDDCFWWYNIGYAQTSLCCMYFIWNCCWITSIIAPTGTHSWSPTVRSNIQLIQMW